jgi:hypothetical protein
MSTKTSVKKATNIRSPELERLIRALEMVASDLPRIMRKEKETAFSFLERVDLFEAHMKEMRAIPAHLEALARVLDRSLQVNGATGHLSRTFQAIHNMRPVEAQPWEGGITPASGEDSSPEAGPAEAQVDPCIDLVASTETPAPDPAVRTDPATGDVTSKGAGRRPYHPVDLNLDRVRDAIVPGGEVSGRSMYRSSRARLVTARASGPGPWRFQFRKGSLDWAAEAESEGLRGVAAMICGDLGYVQVPARLLQERGRDHMMLSSGGNPVLRPAVAVYGSEAIMHPGAMSSTRPGEATKLAFVEF